MPEAVRVGGLRRKHAQEASIPMTKSPGRDCGRWRRRSLIAVALVLTGALLLGACGDDDDGGGDDASFAELSSSLPTGGDLGLDQGSESEWDNATDLLTVFLVIPDETVPSELGTAIEDAGFQGAASLETGGPGLNVRISAAQFDSEEGALEARDLLHDEDLKQPCAEACVVAPREYELEDVPDSAAVHHVPVKGDSPAGPVEGHHAEFVIGPRLYVVQVDGRPSPTFSADFDQLMRTVHESASSAE
jgi:hypothetical protein